MQCLVPVSVYKEIITTWLLAVESEHAEVLLTSVYNSYMYVSPCSTVVTDSKTTTALLSCLLLKCLWLN